MRNESGSFRFSSLVDSVKSSFYQHCSGVSRQSEAGQRGGLRSADSELRQGDRRPHEHDEQVRWHCVIPSFFWLRNCTWKWFLFNDEINFFLIEQYCRLRVQLDDAIAHTAPPIGRTNAFYLHLNHWWTRKGGKFKFAAPHRHMLTVTFSTRRQIFIRGCLNGCSEPFCGCPPICHHSSSSVI